MQYFRQSLVSIPSYIPPPSIVDTINLMSLDEIMNEPVSTKDRKDLNKMYEQADIFVKRNSIVTIKNKKQKKILSNSSGPAQGLSKPILGKEEIHPQLQIMKKEEALFQEIHPADVQKSHEDNIFDYRLHMKLAKSEQVFKVEQVKRKQKKRQMAGKQCECCGRQFSRYHKCPHTICERKCRKAGVKRGESRKQGSSIWSDSKDENWSHQNQDSQKVAKGKSDRKSVRHPYSSSSNHEPHNYGEPSQFLLSSVEKLITEKAENNFTYRVVSIEEYQDESESERQQYEYKDMELEGDQSQLHQGNFYEENVFKSLNQMQMQKQQLNEGNQIYSTPAITAIDKALSLSQGVGQRGGLRMKTNQRVKGKPTNIQPNMLGQMENLQDQSEEEKVKIRSKEYFDIISEEQASNKGKVNKHSMQQDKNQNNQQQNIQQAQGQQQQSQQQSQPQQRNTSQSSNQQRVENPTVQNANQADQRSRIPQSDSSQSIIEEAQIEDLSEQARIPIDDEDKDDFLEIDNPKATDEPINQGEQPDVSNKEDNCLPLDRSSLPQIMSEQDSLDEEIEEIIEANQNQNQSPQKINPQLKISKKQSKQIKTMQKQKLQSDKLQEIQQPDLYLQAQQVKNKLSEKQEELITENKTKNRNDESMDKGKGRGKGRGMGQGKGILEQELDIYSQDSSLLQDKKQQEDQSLMFQKLQQNPSIPSQPKIMSAPQLPIQTPKSPLNQGMTPKRRIPNMERIIQQIKVESKSIQESKGLGRGKIFGRGLGVLEQTEELQKELQEDKLVIQQVFQREKPRKKIKQEQKIERSISSSSMLNEQQQPEMVDKFDELIEEQKVQRSQIIIGQDGQIDQNIQKQESPLSMGYLRYLNKKQTIVEPLQPKEYPSSQQEIEDKSQPSQISSYSIENQLQDPKNFEIQLEQKQINNIEPLKSQEINDFLGEDLSENYNPINKDS